MLVLWLLVVLGAVAASVAAATREETNLVRNYRARSAARYAAESGLIAATTRLERLLAAVQTPVERARFFQRLDQHIGGFADAPLGMARFGIAVADLNARICLNHADEATLVGFFSQFVASREAQGIAEALADWRDPDDLRRPYGAEAAEYRRAGSRFVPANAPLRRLDELRRVRGVTDTLAYTIAPYVTVQGDGRVNLNTAPEPVLAALPGIGAAGARAITQRRRSGEVFTTLAGVRELTRGAPTAARALPAGRVSLTSSRILVISRGWLAGHPLTHEVKATYSIGGRRVVLSAWSERDR